MIDKEFIKENISGFDSLAKSHGAVLCAAIKTRTNDEVDFAIRECGLKIVGENRVQELLYHFQTIIDAGAEVHFIGHLQKNKVKYIADKVSLIESLDSIPLAEEIEKQMSKIGKKMDVLIEVNTGCEEQKSGVFPSDVPSFVSEIRKYPHISVRGLMAVAPKCDGNDEYDKYFSLAKNIFDELFGSDAKSKGYILSMGMSGSYLSALKHGSTEIRIGEKLFGKRENQKM